MSKNVNHKGKFSHKGDTKQNKVLLDFSLKNFSFSANLYKRNKNVKSLFF